MTHLSKNRKSLKLPRRSVLKGMVAGAVGPMIVPAHVLGAFAPSNRITLGCIGMGGQGTYANLNSFLNQADAQICTVCDVFASKRDRARQMVEKRYNAKGCKSVVDFRDIIADRSIDAVVISTPDHWHVPMSLMSLEAGKDVFCEKPTLTIAQGRTLAESVRKHKAVFQVGLEDRSTIQYHKMIEWIRNGAIGRLERIDVRLPRGLKHAKEDTAPVPEGLDYNLWVGPAPFHPYTPNRTKQPYWRMIRDYGSGPLVDWGSHLVDTAQLAAAAPGTCPIEIEGKGLIPKNSLTNVPIEYDVNYRYANGVQLRVRSPKAGEKDVAIRFEGTKGWLGNEGWLGRLQADPESILHTRYTPKASKHWQMPPSEHRNFLDCVKSRKPTTYTAETMHLLHVTLHMGVIAIELGRKLRWDTKAEAFIDDEAANRLRSRPARDDWA